ncbi:unnamed protein product [Tenebrio molitor]|nr:unnamed protein product [Tenebrio molitor]
MLNLFVWLGVFQSLSLVIDVVRVNIVAVDDPFTTRKPPLVLLRSLIIFRYIAPITRGSLQNLLISFKPGRLSRIKRKCRPGILIFIHEFLFRACAHQALGAWMVAVRLNHLKIPVGDKCIMAIQ